MASMISMETLQTGGVHTSWKKGKRGGGQRHVGTKNTRGIPCHRGTASCPTVGVCYYLVSRRRGSPCYLC